MSILERIRRIFSGEDRTVDTQDQRIDKLTSSREGQALTQSEGGEFLRTISPPASTRAGPRRRPTCTIRRGVEAATTTEEEVRESGLVDHLEEQAAHFWDVVQGETQRGHRYNTGRVTGRDGYDEGL